MHRNPCNSTAERSSQTKQVEKWTRAWIGFSKEDGGGARYITSCSASLTVRDLQIQATVRPPSPVGKATIRKTRITSVGEGVEKGEPRALLVQPPCGSVEVARAVRTTGSPTSGYLYRGTEVRASQRHLHPHSHCSTGHNTQGLGTT